MRLELRVEDFRQSGQEVRVPAGDQLQVLDNQPAALFGQIQQSSLRGCPKVGLTDVQRGDCVRIFRSRGFDDGVQNVDEGVSCAESASVSFEVIKNSSKRKSIKQSQAFRPYLHTKSFE